MPGLKSQFAGWPAVVSSRRGDTAAPPAIAERSTRRAARVARWFRDTFRQRESPDRGEVLEAVDTWCQAPENGGYSCSAILRGWWMPKYPHDLPDTSENGRQLKAKDPPPTLQSLPPRPWAHGVTLSKTMVPSNSRNYATKLGLWDHRHLRARANQAWDHERSAHGFWECPGPPRCVDRGAVK